MFKSIACAGLQRISQPLRRWPQFWAIALVVLSLVLIWAPYSYSQENSFQDIYSQTQLSLDVEESCFEPQKVKLGKQDIFCVKSHTRGSISIAGETNQQNQNDKGIEIEAQKRAESISQRLEALANLQILEPENLQIRFIREGPLEEEELGQNLIQIIYLINPSLNENNKEIVILTLTKNDIQELGKGIKLPDLPENFIVNEALLLLRKSIRNYREERKSEYPGAQMLLPCDSPTQTVRLDDKPLFCIRTWVKENESQLQRRKKIEEKIRRIADGEINPDSLGIIDLENLDPLLGISDFVNLSSNAAEVDHDNDDNYPVAIVSDQRSLLDPDRLIVVVSRLDADLEPAAKSPSELASLYLKVIQDAVSASREDQSIVQFDWGPYRSQPFKSLCALLHCINVSSAQHDSELPIQNSNRIQELFKVDSAAQFKDSAERASIVSKRIQRLSNNLHNLNEFCIRKRKNNNSAYSSCYLDEKDPQEEYIIATGQDEEDLILTLTYSDLPTEKLLLGELDSEYPQYLYLKAEQKVKEIKTVIQTYRIYSFWASIYSIIILLFTAGFYALTCRFLNRLMHISCKDKVSSGSSTKGRDAQNNSSLEDHNYTQIVCLLLRRTFLGLFLVAFLLCLYMMPGPFKVLNSILNWTKLNIQAGWSSICLYSKEDLPKLFFVLATAILSILLLRLLMFSLLPYVCRMVHREWRFRHTRCETLFYILSFVIVVVAFVAASQHLPGAGTAYLAGVSAFVALAFSLSASAAIADVIAGFVLIFLTPLDEDDWVKIGDISGQIVEQNLLLHRIRTYKQNLVTVPNSKILNSLITNYSASIKDKSINHLVLHTTITLGYDVPWRKVEVVLLRAAQRTEGLFNPSVLQTSLDDFYVSYELNACTQHTEDIPKIYSQLHQNIQDECLAAGIEILSPHYEASRDGSAVTIPDWLDLPNHNEDSPSSQNDDKSTDNDKSAEHSKPQ